MASVKGTIGALPMPRRFCFAPAAWVLTPSRRPQGVEQIGKIFGNTIAKQSVSRIKMTQLPQSRSLSLAEPFKRSANVGRWLEGSWVIFRTPSTQKQYRSKASFSSCGSVTLPMKKRGWRP